MSYCRFGKLRSPKNSVHQKLVNCWTTPKKFFLNKFRVLGKRWSWCGLDLIFFVFTLHWSSEFGSAKYFVDCFVWLYFCCFHFVLCFRIWNHNCQVIIHNFKTWHLFFNSSDRSGRYPKFYPPGSGNTQLTGFGSPRCIHWFGYAYSTLVQPFESKFNIKLTISISASM